jgi:hypothetical protein
MLGMDKPHPNKGRKQSPEHIAKRVATRKANGTYKGHNGQERVEVKVKQSAAMKARWERGDFVDKPTFTQHSPETIEKMRETRRRMWAEGRYENRRPATRRAVSVMERSLRPYLEKLGYVHTEIRDCFITCDDKVRMPDFVDTTGRRVFEFFGNFWHHPDDEQRWVEAYARKGWACIVLWEDELQEWLDVHQELVSPDTHADALHTSRARHRYSSRGNDRIVSSAL